MVSNVKVEGIDLHSKFRRKTNCSFDIMLWFLIQTFPHPFPGNVVCEINLRSGENKFPSPWKLPNEPPKISF